MTDLPSAFLLPVDKPEGPTSHDVVGVVRRALGVKRVGHTGTLDPFASGLLLLCVGTATRLAEYFSGLDKTYEAVARLGVRTDTLDRDGRVVAETEAWRDLAPDRVEEVLARFVGELEQVPPAFSAKKVDGERAYRRAREGREVELDACRVVIRSLQLLSLDLPELRFRVECSSGTYVRALARDIGEQLGVGAHLTGLRRTAIGAWDVADAVSVDDLTTPGEALRHAVLPLEALAHLPHVEVDDQVAERLALGQAVRLTEAPPSGAPLAVAHGGVLLAIGEADDGVLRPRKVFAA